MNLYDVETSVTLTGSFFGADGNPADPTTVTLYVQRPDGTVTQLTGGEVTRASTGVYTAAITTDQSGPWAYQWQGAGAVVATSPEVYFQVNASSLIAAPGTWPPS